MDVVYGRQRRVIGGAPSENSFLSVKISTGFLTVLAFSLGPILSLLGYGIYALVAELHVWVRDSDRGLINWGLASASNFTYSWVDTALDFFWGPPKGSL